MNFETFNINCPTCGETRMVKIKQTVAGGQIDWLETKDNQNNRIISARERLDGQWGFQCLCGNNDIMTEQEKRIITDPTNPAPQEVAEIVENLEPDPQKFNMETA